MTANEPSPFHEGEIAIQERVGVRERIDAFARRVVRSYLTEQHRAFFPQLAMLLVGSVDETGRPLASMLCGAPGFVRASDERTLRIDARLAPHDPLFARLAIGLEVGILGIELHTRRRNRLSGTVVAIDDAGFSVAVKQSFGNCPQYIHTRMFSLDPAPLAATVRTSDALDEDARRWLGAADTFFIASAWLDGSSEPSRGADISHRGGAPGFVRIEDDRTLLVPDFPGNHHYNTLGNIEKNPRVSLLVPDFESGALLRIAARAEILWDKPAALAAFVGAERFVRFFIDEVARIDHAMALRWTRGEPSPNVSLVGSFAQAEASYAAEQDRSRFVEYEVARIVEESAVIRSLYLRRRDGGTVPLHTAGQYLPIRVTLPADRSQHVRNYTISNAPRPETFRISVRRELRPGSPPGLVSNYVHDHVAVGDILEARAPRGAFVLDTQSPRVAVMLSAGVGITPMIAMLEEIAARALRHRERRRVFFVHGALDGATHAFKRRVREIAAALDDVEVHHCYERPRNEDRLGVDYHSEGRVDLALLKDLLPFGDHDFYLCGPPAFMTALYDGLLAEGVRAERIRFESFGPASIGRRAAVRAASAEDEPILVTLRRSKKVLPWSSANGTLLDLVESAGVDAPSSCRRGDCGTCRTRIAAGRVTYPDEPTAEHAADEVLLCSAHPTRATADDRAKNGGDVVLDV